MKLHSIQSEKEFNDEQRERVRKFFLEVIDLCNKHRVTFILKTILLLQTNVIDGKLLDVAGFQYDKDSKISVPVFVDRMSKEEGALK